MAASIATRPTPVWLVPHFEQMLYDNAQLARVYLHAWAQTGETRFRDVATGTLDYMIRELTTVDGAFAASQDADTEGVEGLTFVWSAAEIREVLGDDAAPFMAAYGVTDEGNWEARSRSSRGSGRRSTRRRRRARTPRSRPDWRRLAPSSWPAGRPGRSRPATTRRSRRGTAWRSRLLPMPRDCCAATIPTPPSGIAPRPCGRPRRSSAGSSSADGALGRSWKDGRATGQGVLEDYSHLADGLLALYEATFDERWFTTARGLMDRVLARFADPAGGFFDTADDHERLVARPKDVQDNAVPSGNAMATLVLLRLAAWTGEGRYRDAAERALRTVVSFVDRYPTGFAQWLSAMDLALAPVVEVAIVGEPGDPATQVAPRGRRVRLPPAPGRRGQRGAGGESSSRCSPIGSPSTAGRPPTSAAGSSAGCRSPTSRPSVRSSPTVAEPVEPRPAATVVLLRQGRHGQEVLLGRRPASMAFAPDVHVFPGGRVDPTDAHPSLIARSVVSPEAAAVALGGDLPPTQAIAAYVAAIREVVRGGRRAARRCRSAARRRARSGPREPPWSAARSGSRRSPRSST